ncbi:MAG: DNA alkylation repair protein [Rhodobacterales bacterium]|nr:DNA alkylation repair protein [Rhodobacterales bacterium]
MTPPVDQALAQLQARADPDRAAVMAAQHRATRRYLGLPGPAIAALVEDWRDGATVADRLQLAAALWDSDVHEARVAATKLVTQARIRPDAAVWDLICRWVPQVDGLALADLVATAGQKRLVADPVRLDLVATWVRDPRPWTRRMALAMTLPWAKMAFPKPADLAVRDRVLGWAADLAADPDRLVQRAVAGWLQDLSRHDADRARAWHAVRGDRP